MLVILPGGSMPKKNEKPFEKQFALKIHVKSRKYDYAKPWGTPTFPSSTGSGFIIEGNRIVTNAHVVDGAIFIEVELAKDSKKYTAKIKKISHECDLAEITVDDEEFWEKTYGLEIGETPHLKQKVEVHGFPMGGDGYCITKGNISRVENQVYVHSGQTLLNTQLTAPINPGNSGGAVITTQKGEIEEGEILQVKVVGVVHQVILNSHSIGYMIPAEVLKHFLKQVETNTMGFPTLGFQAQTMENPYLRQKYKMQEEQSGVLIHEIPDISSAKGKLQPGDILMAIDGKTIDNNGTVHVESIGSIDYRYLINYHQLGDEITLKVLRAGKEHEEKITLRNLLGQTSNIPKLSYGDEPTYYIIAGVIVVQPVTRNYVVDSNAKFTSKYKSDPADQLIVISTIFESEYSKGYQEHEGALITKVNGIAINNLGELIKAIEQNTQASHIIETSSGEIVIPRLCQRLRKKVLADYHLQAECSSDLMPPKPILQDNFLDAMLAPEPLPLIFSKETTLPASIEPSASSSRGKEKEEIPDGIKLPAKLRLKATVLSRLH